ncbi:MAG: sulfatase [Myxococcota bacterium]|nr:sulfatase [Myxococcota bacterium]
MKRTVTAALCWALGSTIGCGVSTGPVDRTGVPAGVLLDRYPEKLVRLEIPENNREAVDGPVEITGDWKLTASQDGVQTWQASLPVRPRALFFYNPPAGMRALRRSGESEADPWAKPKVLRHSKGVRYTTKVDSWEFGRTTLKVRREEADGRPAPGEYAVDYELAVTREKSFNRDQSEAGDDNEFVFRSVQVGDANAHGLFLPAPAEATFDVAVPTGGVLDFEALLVPPEAATARASDGASLRIRVRSGDGEEDLMTLELAPGDTGGHRVEFGAWAGQQVELSFLTDPGPEGDNYQDYLFVAEPTVHVPDPDPPRTVILFIDTLRQDHLSLYGYERQTTPRIDAWAQQSAVFEQARSIAPWTLPSSRTILTGALPERWDTVERLQQRFARAGWSTAAIMGNVYLSSNFDMAEQWGVHRCVNSPMANVQVDRAWELLEARKDRPVFLVLHFMDVHLPYEEPQKYRSLWAEDTPAVLGDELFIRGDILPAAEKLGPEGKQYVRDRYDGTLRYVDDQVGRFLEGLGPSDTVILLADHGEEFWDHGAFEHGHSLYDEVLRIPMVLSGPGVVPGRYSEPVSLLDVAPTLALQAGLSREGMQGWPLQELADGSRAAEFAERPQGFGRPLYGTRVWGSLTGGAKYVSRGALEKVYDLESDPGESENLVKKGADRTAGRQALSDALGVPVVEALRLYPSPRRASKDLEMRLTVPGGIQTAWAGDDPTRKSNATVEVDGDQAHAVWSKGYSGSREVFVVPREPVKDAVNGLQILLTSGEKTEGVTLTSDSAGSPLVDGSGEPLVKTRFASRKIQVSYVVTPLPHEQAAVLDGFDEEMAEDLRALGYIE